MAPGKNLRYFQIELWIFTYLLLLFLIVTLRLYSMLASSLVDHRAVNVNIQFNHVSFAHLVYQTLNASNNSYGNAMQSKYNIRNLKRTLEKSTFNNIGTYCRGFCDLFAIDLMLFNILLLHYRREIENEIEYRITQITSTEERKIRLKFEVILILLTKYIQRQIVETIPYNTKEIPN